MKRLICASLIGLGFLGWSPAQAGDVGISVSLGQPGFYGRIDIGNIGQPQRLMPSHASSAVCRIGRRRSTCACRPAMNVIGALIASATALAVSRFTSSATTGIATATYHNIDGTTAGATVGVRTAKTTAKSSVRSAVKTGAPTGGMTGATSAGMKDATTVGMTNVTTNMTIAAKAVTAATTAAADH
ncbi:hypothetical protein ACVBEH_06480 [Roseateles sp. GG27B]